MQPDKEPCHDNSQPNRWSHRDPISDDEKLGLRISPAEWGVKRTHKAFLNFAEMRNACGRPISSFAVRFAELRRETAAANGIQVRSW